MLKQILFDFDGVIIDSMDVRDEGFRMIAKKVADNEIVEEFIKYHRYNAGLSRFVKIRYLYEEMLNKSITDEQVNKLATEFSILMKQKLTDKKVLINETVDFIKSIHKDVTLHIVSGSEEKELNYLCSNLHLSDYFKTIEGSPTPKNTLVKDIMQKYNYEKIETILIGDSINDYEAADMNGIGFIGFNNTDLKTVSDNYVDIVDHNILAI